MHCFDGNAARISKLFCHFLACLVIDFYSFKAEEQKTFRKCDKSTSTSPVLNWFLGIYSFDNPIKF